MSSRFVSNLIVLLCGGFLIAASLAFNSAVIGWLGLGVGALVTATLLCAFALRGRGIAQRTFDGFLFAAAAWTIVASRCFAGVTLKWLMFSSGAVAVLLALSGLIVHEVLTQMALRSRLETRTDARVTSTPREPATLGVVGSG
ncbi:MAG TPA: hypothetical protein VKV16_06755 [Solirubrobacteraceae bacterium]|nr:hypothetical protein [Solirubrobacteraceae bacterium]